MHTQGAGGAATIPAEMKEKEMKDKVMALLEKLNMGDKRSGKLDLDDFLKYVF